MDYSIPTINGESIDLSEDEVRDFWTFVAQHQDELPQNLRNKLQQNNAFEGVGSITS